MFLPARDPAATSGVGSFDMTEAERRIAGIATSGVVTAVDYSDTANPRVRVGIGESEDEDGYIETDWLPMATGRSNEWNPLKVGETVQVHSESGELQNGVVGHSIHNEAHPAPGNRPDLWRKTFADGGALAYDEAAGELSFSGTQKATITVAGASLAITPDGITLTVGDQTLALGADGLTHNGVNVGSEHVHSGVQTGTGLSGAPQ